MDRLGKNLPVLSKHLFLARLFWLSLKCLLNTGQTVFWDPCGWGWSGGAMVLGKLPVPRRPTNTDYSRARRAYCTCSRCGGGCLDSFSLVYHFSLLSPFLCETARYRLKYCLKRLLSPKQPTHQPMRMTVLMRDTPYVFLKSKRITISEKVFLFRGPADSTIRDWKWLHQYSFPRWVNDSLNDLFSANAAILHAHIYIA